MATKNNIKFERYIGKDNKIWIRIKVFNKYRTEVLMQESEFEKKYGKYEEYVI